jgi:CHAT domain-containing protein
LHGNYHLLHFAGHGWKGGEEAALTVIDDQAKDRYVALPASTLGEWVQQSDLRLIYLSSCQGIGEQSERPELAIRSFENLAEALVFAGVPEVVGFRWPILDQQSLAFAERFHTAFLNTFDASFAVFRARISFQPSAQIWAAAVVMGQYDSPPQPST